MICVPRKVHNHHHYLLWGGRGFVQVNCDGAWAHGDVCVDQTTFRNSISNSLIQLSFQSTIWPYISTYWLFSGRHTKQMLTIANYLDSLEKKLSRKSNSFLSITLTNNFRFEISQTTFHLRIFRSPQKDVPKKIQFRIYLIRRICHNLSNSPPVATHRDLQIYTKTTATQVFIDWSHFYSCGASFSPFFLEEEQETGLQNLRK